MVGFESALIEVDALELIFVSSKGGVQKVMEAPPASRSFACISPRRASMAPVFSDAAKPTTSSQKVKAHVSWLGNVRAAAGTGADRLYFGDSARSACPVPEEWQLTKALESCCCLLFSTYVASQE